MESKRSLRSCLRASSQNDIEVEASVVMLDYLSAEDEEELLVSDESSFEGNPNPKEDTFVRSPE